MPTSPDRISASTWSLAEERDGGYYAIQYKCYAADARLPKSDLYSFIVASMREPFVSRLLVHTGSELGVNVVKTIQGLKSPCSVLYSSDLAKSPIHWPDLVRKNRKTCFDCMKNIT